MRSAAKSSASTASGEQLRAAVSISPGEIRNVAGVSSTRSSRAVNSRSAASPLRRTDSTIAATAASTSAAASRFSARSAVNATSNPEAPASSLRGIGGLPETLQPGADLLWPGLQRRAIHDQARGDVGDALDLHQSIRLQGGASLHEIDDAPAETELRRQLHGAVELDALRLHAPRGEMPTGDLRVFGGDAHAAPAGGVLP